MSLAQTPITVYVVQWVPHVPSHEVNAMSVHHSLKGAVAKVVDMCVGIEDLTDEQIEALEAECNIELSDDTVFIETMTIAA